MAVKAAHSMMDSDEEKAGAFARSALVEAEISGNCPNVVAMKTKIENLRNEESLTEREITIIGLVAAAARDHVPLTPGALFGPSE